MTYYYLFIIAFMVLVIVAELCNRNFLGSSFRPTIEICGIAFLWMAFIGLIPLYENEGLMRLDFLVSKDKGHTGKVLQVSPSENKVIVEGQNMVTKHVKPRRQGEQGGIVKAEGAMYASKVMPICPKCGKAVRVGHVEKDGKMVRVCKKCGAEL